MNIEAAISLAISPADSSETELQKLREYHEGRQITSFGDKAAFLSEGIKTLLGDYAPANVCEHAVSVLSERLNLQSFEDVSESGFAALANKWWAAREMASWQSDLIRFVLRDKAAVLVVGWDGEAPTFKVNELWDGAASSGMRIFHDANGEATSLCKKWAETADTGILTGRTRLTIYLPDSITRLVADPGGQYRMLTPNEIFSQGGGLLEQQNPQPLVMQDGTPVGLVAVPFYNAGYVSEVRSVLVAQEMLNENLLSWYASAQLHGFPSIAIEGDVDAEINPVTGKKKDIMVGAGKIWKTGGPPMKRLEAADIGAIFDGIVRPAIELAALNKRWPVHMFLPASMPSSGELVRQLETPLVQQIGDKQRLLGDSFVRAMIVARRLGNYLGLALGDLGSVTARWQEAARRDELYDVSVVQAKKLAGNLPDEFVWELLGYDPVTIGRLHTLASAQSARNFQTLLSDTTVNTLGQPSQQ